MGQKSLSERAMASLNAALWIADASGCICEVNESYTKLTGYSKAEAIGQHYSVLHGPDTDPAALADLKSAFENGSSAVTEILCYHKNGNLFWAWIGVSQVEEDDYYQASDAGHFVAVIHDVTARKKTEAAFRLRSKALCNLSEGICITDPTKPDNPITYCNDAFCHITGYSRDQVLGRNCRFLQGPATSQETVNQISKAVKEGRDIVVEILNYRKGGEEFYNLLSITPVKDPSTGQLTALIGVQSDITELVHRRKAEHLLKAAKVAAETADEAKTMFLAHMSHEIRTPLNGMIAVAQLLLGSQLTPEQRELTETISDSGNTLLSILGDILDFSKIDHNRLSLEAAPLMLRDVVEAALEMVSVESGRKGLDVAYSLLDPELALRPILGDSIRVKQILCNLLSNAVKFTEHGDVVIEAYIEGTDTGAPTSEPSSPGSIAASSSSRGEYSATSTQSRCPLALHVTIKDSGIGIAEDSMRSLFKPFRQGNTSMSRMFGGTGLGLVISRRLAKLMGGSVWADSTPGKGSVFHYTMDLRWADEDLDEVDADEALPEKEEEEENCTYTGLQLEEMPELELCTEYEKVMICQRHDTAASVALRHLQQSIPSLSLTTTSEGCLAAAAGGGGGGPPTPSIGGMGHQRLPSSVLSMESSSSAATQGAHELTSSNRQQSASRRSSGDGPHAQGGSARSSTSDRRSVLAADYKMSSLYQSSDAMHNSSECEGVQLPQILEHRVRKTAASSLLQQPTSPMSTVPHAFRSEGEEMSMLKGKTVVIHVDHRATAQQVTESCKSLGMFTIEDLSAAAAEVCIACLTTAPDVLTSGWKGRPLIILGQKNDSPYSMHPLAYFVSRPVKHTRLTAVLIKAAAWSAPFTRLGPSQAPLQQSVSRETCRRISLDNSALYSCTTGAIASAKGSLPLSASSFIIKEHQHYQLPALTWTPRILIAEDNLVNQRVITRVLKSVMPDAPVEVAGNGVEVLEAVKRSVYDLILMDIHMPLMDGLEASRKVREMLPPEKQPMIVALSADTQAQLGDGCRDAGIEQFISKPFRIEDVQGVLCSLKPRLGTCLN